MTKFLLPFLLSFLITVFLLFVFIYLGQRINWTGRDSKRHIHKPGVSRIGGLAMVIAFNAAIILNPDLFISPELYGFMLGTLILLVAGVWDDIREIFWKIQLFIQTAAAILVFIMGVRIYYITNPLSGNLIFLDSGIGVIISAALAVVWILAVINALNWSDGIDGMAGGITFITSATIFFLSLYPEVNQPPVAIISAVLCGTVLGLLLFNFYPSRVLAGTSGSMFMGFSLAVLAIFAGTKIATSLLVLALPLIDFLWVIGERIRNGRSIFKPDKNHLHYKLMEMGWSQRKIVLTYWFITALIAAIALNTRAIGKSITLLSTGIIMVIILILINKKTTSA